MNQKRYAYLIGANGPNKMRLNHAEKDIFRLADALKGYLCQFEEVKSIIAHTRDDALADFKRLVDKCDASSLLIVHFSGHAIYDEQLYLLCNNTDLNDIYTTAIEINTIKTVMRKSKAQQKLLILDCCRAAGAHLGTLKGTRPEDEKTFKETMQATFQGSATFILAACSKGENTRELDDLDGGSGFLSWAVRAACTNRFHEASSSPASQALSLHDLWHLWMPKALEEVNSNLNVSAQIPHPILVGEQESGHGSEIWLTPLPRSNKDEINTKENIFKSRLITQPDYFDQKVIPANISSHLFDHMPCTEASLADLNLEKIDAFLDRDLVRRQKDFKPDRSLQAQLERFGFLRNAHPTYGALLCFGYTPQVFLPSAITRCVYWDGNTRDKGYIDDMDCTGDLIEQIEACTDFIRKCLRRRREIGANGRNEQYDTPLIALQEVIANALIHREYAIFKDDRHIVDTKYVQIELFDNRIEIKSPGSPPIPLDLLLKEDVSHPVNALIARIFYLYGHVERAGSGLQRTQKAMRDANLPLPTFKLSDAKNFKVTLERPQLLLPSPNVLSVLGEIDFKPWQCIAELVDNSVDSFLRMTLTETPIDTPTVHIVIEQDNVIIRDNGPGMSLRNLRNAVKAGWTSNEPFGNLGLYGVGFNIATARLGSLTTIWTTQTGDTTWYGLEINLQEISRQEHYQLEVKTRIKSDHTQSGTEVVVTKIRPDWKDSFNSTSWIRTNITNRLASIYGTMLRDLNPQPVKFSLYMNNKKVFAWEHCVWSAELTVYRKEEGDVRPIQEIDVIFGEKYISRSTGTTYNTREDYEQEGIDATDIVVVPERVYGWIGIQRYADEKEFGIDILRNGRKIEVGCKDLFTWEQEDGDATPEYPIDDLRQRGRIVGELHLDHGHIHYTKHQFEREHSSWKQLLQAVRNNEPLTVRDRQGYAGVNISPLGILFRAFRRNTPSKGQRWADILFIKENEKAKNWAKECRKGNQPYCDDQFWEDELQKCDNDSNESKA